jgi:hypothetical protein
MKFKLWLENNSGDETEQLIKLYKSLLKPEDIQNYYQLKTAIDNAYRSKNYKLAEKLEVQLEELLERLDSQLEDMDDNDASSREGQEDEELDYDWSLQDEFAKKYAQYLGKTLEPIGQNITDKQFASLLRSIVYDIPNISISSPNINVINQMSDEQIINAAKDAYENKLRMRNRMQNPNKYKQYYKQRIRNN